MSSTLYQKCVFTLFDNQIALVKTWFLQVPPICRKHSAFRKRDECTRFLLFLAQGKSQFSSERSAAFSHCHKAAMLACALRSSSSQKSHFVAIFGSPFSAPLFGNTLPLAGKVNARDFNTFLQKQKPRFLLLHFAPRGRCDGRG